MGRRFEDLWKGAASDGASCPVGVFSDAGAADLDTLMDAWYRERSQRIEATLLLDEARRLMRSLLAEGPVTPQRRRQLRRVIRLIRTHLAPGD